jgi:hypothetical protein
MRDEQDDGKESWRREEKREDFLMGELSAEPTLYTVLLSVWLMISGSTYACFGKRR